MVSTSRCGRDNPGSNPGRDIFSTVSRRLSSKAVWDIPIVVIWDISIVVTVLIV